MNLAKNPLLYESLSRKVSILLLEYPLAPKSTIWLNYRTVPISQKLEMVNNFIVSSAQDLYQSVKIIDKPIEEKKLEDLHEYIIRLKEVYPDLLIPG